MSTSLGRFFQKQLFHKNDRGETIYYPFGVFGSGYLVPAEQFEDVSRTALSLLFAGVALSIGAAVAPFVILGTGARTEFLAYAGVAGILLLMVLALHRQTRGLACVGRPTAGDWFKQARRQRSKLIHGLEIGLGLLGVPVLLAIFLGDPGSIYGSTAALVINTLVLAALCVFLVWDGIMGLIEKRRAATA